MISFVGRNYPLETDMLLGGLLTMNDLRESFNPFYSVLYLAIKQEVKFTLLPYVCR